MTIINRTSEFDAQARAVKAAAEASVYATTVEVNWGLYEPARFWGVPRQRAPWEIFQDTQNEMVKRLAEELFRVAPGPIEPMPAPAPDPNAAMIARDGPAQLPPDSLCVCGKHTSPGVVHRSDGPCYVKSTAKPALASLTRMTAMSHMLGNGIKG